MTLQQIEYFLTVAETGNFSKAARKLFSSQPTLTRQIQLLEQELGGPLFIRNKRPMQLNDAGKIFYEGMKKAVDQIGYTKELTKTALGGKYGSLSIGFLSGFHSEYIYLPVVKELKETCPTLLIQCIKMNASGLLRGLQNEELDVAISVDLPIFETEEIEKTKLQHLDTLVVTALDHPIAINKFLAADSFAGETIYLPLPLDESEIKKRMGNSFDLSATRFVKVSGSENVYMKVLTEGGIAISNKYDPAIRDSSLYFCCRIGADYLHPYINAYVSRLKQNPVRDLFLELLKKGDEKRL